MSYIRVCEDVGFKPVELPLEDDGSLHVETLKAQFPYAVGLKYLPDPSNDIFRGIRCNDGKLMPPQGGWGDITFYCTFPPEIKRKIEEDATTEPASKKHAGSKQVKCADLILLGLDRKTTEESLRKYFEEKYGELLMALVKTDLYTMKPKGFGFIRFAKYEDQVKALTARKHEIDGKWVILKTPYAKEGVESAVPSKVFLSRLQPSITNEDLTEFFSKYGDVADLFYPKTPFKGFAFLTFFRPESADEAVADQPHIIKGFSVAVVHANDQPKKPAYGEMGGGSRGGYRGRGGKFGRGRGGYASSSRNASGGYSGGYEDHYSAARDDISKVLAVALLDKIGGDRQSAGGGQMNARAAPVLKNDAPITEYVNYSDTYKNDYSYNGKQSAPYVNDKANYYMPASKYSSKFSSSRY